MSFFIFYTVSFIACALAMLALGWYTLNFEKQDIQVAEILLGVVLTLIPVVNTVMVFVIAVFLVTQFSNRVVFKAKK